MAYISKNGISNTSTIAAEHITRIIDALDGTSAAEVSASGQFDGSHSGSFTGSFIGDGTNITGVTAEWDGTHVGDAQITGSLIVTGALTASGDISSSGHINAQSLETKGRATVDAFIITPKIQSPTTVFEVNDNLKVVGNVTASGEISASGNIIGTDITASGNILASEVNATNFNGLASQATTAVNADSSSYVNGARVDGTVAQATDATNATNVTITSTTTNQDFNIHFGSETSGNDGVNVASSGAAITYNPSSRLLVARRASFSDVSGSNTMHTDHGFNKNITYVDCETVAAAGEGDQGTAAALSGDMSLSYVTSTHPSLGVVLPRLSTITIPNAGYAFQKIIINTSDTACKLFPGSNDALGSLSDNASITVAANSTVMLYAFDATKWVGGGMTGLSEL